MEKQMQMKSLVVFPSMNQHPEFFMDENDLCNWEFINSSDSDADDVLSLSDDSCLSSPRDCPIPNDLSSFSSSPEDCPIRDLIQEYEPFHDGYGDSYMDHPADQVVNDEYYHQDEDEDDEEEEEEDDGYDLDDELVPRGLIGKLGRQRMRKLGKRAFAKMNSSKKSPFLYMKPGCVHGKHGLGLKHSC